MRCRTCFTITDSSPRCRICGEHVGVPSAEAFDGLRLDAALARSRSIDDETAENLVTLWLTRECDGLRPRPEASPAVAALAAYWLARAGRPDEAAAWIAHLPDGDFSPTQFSLTMSLHSDESGRRLAVADLIVLSCPKDGAPVGPEAHLPPPFPIDWDRWRTVTRAETAAVRAMDAALRPATPGATPDAETILREHRRLFQHSLSERQDVLGLPDAIADVQRAVHDRDRGFFKICDIVAWVAGLKTASEAASPGPELEQRALEEARAFAQQSLRVGGLAGVAAARDHLRRASARVETELRRTRETQERACLRAREVLIATMHDLQRKARGVMWSLVRSDAMYDAVEQSRILTVRIREADALSQTGTWMTRVTTLTDDALVAVETRARRAAAMVERLQRGTERVLRDMAQWDPEIAASLSTEAFATRSWEWIDRLARTEPESEAETLAEVLREAGTVPALA